MPGLNFELERAGRALTRGDASPGPTSWPMCVLLGCESHGGPLVRRFKRHLPEPKLGQSWLDRLNSQPMWGGWRPSDRNVLWAFHHRARTSMSAETLNIGNNHQIQEQNELVSSFRNLQVQRPKAAQSWGQGAINWQKKHPNPAEAQ